MTRAETPHAAAGGHRLLRRSRPGHPLRRLRARRAEHVPASELVVAAPSASCRSAPARNGRRRRSRCTGPTFARAKRPPQGEPCSIWSIAAPIMLPARIASPRRLGTGPPGRGRAGERSGRVRRAGRQPEPPGSFGGGGIRGRVGPLDRGRQALDHEWPGRPGGRHLGFDLRLDALSARVTKTRSSRSRPVRPGCGRGCPAAAPPGERGAAGASSAVPAPLRWTGGSRGTGGPRCPAGPRRTQRFVRRDARRRAFRAVPQRGRDHQFAPSADLHPRDAFFPSGDHRPLPSVKRERFVALPRGVEFLAALEVDAHVVHRHRSRRLWLRRRCRRSGL